tara:strand:- start:3588 stop:3725 length:138 start_codon:yes stop_codon:yes gene_type:complete
MIIQFLNNNNIVLLPVKDCGSESLISHIDGSRSFDMLLDRLFLTR